MEPMLEFSRFLNLCLYRYFLYCELLPRMLSLETPKQVFPPVKC